MKTKLWLFLGLVCGMGLLSGCRFVVDTHINADGSGELKTVVIYTAGDVNFWSQNPDNKSKDICDNPNAPEGVVLTKEEHDGETHCIKTRTFTNLSELRQFYEEDKNVTLHELEFKLGVLILDMDIASPEVEEGQGFTTEWLLTLPGPIGENNAETVDGQTLKWQFVSGETIHVHAESSPALSWTTLGPTGQQILVAIVGLGILIGLLVMFFIMRRR